MTLFYVVVAILAVVVMSVYVSWRAGRLDRLHHRTDGARTALDLALVRRSSSAYELASSGLLDPATSVLLADAARRVKEGEGTQGFEGSREARGTAGADGSRDRVLARELAESDLTRALRAAFSQPEFRLSIKGNEGAEELVAEVEAAAHQVYLARKFYNDVAARTLDARRKRLARALRLAGHAPKPAFFEMDDAVSEE